jgi:signal transduction histidine kinase
VVSDAVPLSDLTLAGLVHDLNNVFETISESADLLAGDPEWAHVAAALLRSVERGQRIVGCYAGQSRTGQDLDDVVDRAAVFLQDFLRVVPGAGKIKVAKRLGGGARLQGPASDWERVFMNLFLNAAQAMKETGGTITVEAERKDGDVVVSVADDGPGIPAALLGKIFLSRVSTKSKQGGLGLHIVRSLVETNGGTVSAANREEGGAVFRMTLPAIE